MASSISSLPDHQVNQYKIIITPSEDVAERIINIQKDFINKYQVVYKSVYRPQIILVSFKQFQAHEERIINRLKMVGMGFPLLKIELKGFGSFPSHTLFINVSAKNGIDELIRKIKEQSQRLLKMDSENRPHFMNQPHLTVVRKLKHWQYEQGWLEFRHQHFTGTFVASKMMLLRKKAGDHNFIPIESFEFQNLPVETKQGKLF